MIRKHTAMAAVLTIATGTLVAGLGISASAAEPGRSADRPTHTSTGDQGQKGVDPTFMRSQRVLGMSVYDRSGDDVGSIKDLIVDARTGRVTGAALAIGAWMGIGDKVVLTRANDIRWDRNAKRMTLETAKEALKDAPRFDENSWQDLERDQWIDAIKQWKGSGRRNDHMHHGMHSDRGMNGMQDGGGMHGMHNDRGMNGMQDDGGMHGNNGMGNDNGMQNERGKGMSNDQQAASKHFLFRLSDIQDNGGAASSEKAEKSGSRRVDAGESAKEVGRINGAIVEMHSERVPLVVVASGGDLGGADKLRLVPVRAMRMSESSTVLEGITPDAFDAIEPVTEDQIANLKPSDLERYYRPFGLRAPDFQTRTATRY